MSLQASWQKYTLDFTFVAGTSRGTMNTRDTWILKVWHDKDAEVYGLGEAGPLPGLSLDHRPDFEEMISRVARVISTHSAIPNASEVPDYVAKLVPEEWPSIRFALETALLDLAWGGRRIIVPRAFTRSVEVPINGLIWMGDKGFMLEQMETKLKAGFNCLKMKIGAIAREEENEVLRAIRERRSPEELILRVDANGAFSAETAVDELNRLKVFGLHSIEQPIKPGQWEAMAAICRDSPVPVALDEELIGLHSIEERAHMLDTVKPFGIVLKPGLVGGLQATREWIALAEERNIAWWITSALESNIGLNAIAQLTASLQPAIHQGLGTGQLYHNNFPSPMVITQDSLRYDAAADWDFSQLHI